MFNFEKDLAHQQKAVKAIIKVFEGIPCQKATGIEGKLTNPIFDKEDLQYTRNIGAIQEKNDLERRVKGRSNILDIMMETGTGKTYTYTKTIFELNKHYGIFKFVIIVPTLPIKAGTIDFLKSTSARQHFQEQYGKTIKLHIVESKKSSKSKKHHMPLAVSQFVQAGTFEKSKIQVLIINAGMLNSKTMTTTFDKLLFDFYAVPFQAIQATRPFVILDEPHKFDQSKKTWTNIQNISPQFILRYGATFKARKPKPSTKIKRYNLCERKEDKYENLLYKLSAVDAFNKNLVKGVIGHITDFKAGKNTMVKFVNSDGQEATFHLIENHQKKTIKVIPKESLEKIHPAMVGLLVERLNKTTLQLSNGLLLKKGDMITPYSYGEKVQERMIQQAIEEHFKLERKFFTRKTKIKPLTLFFIDNIEEYRSKEGYIRKTVEKYIKAEVDHLMQNETNDDYKQYLEKTLEDIGKTHGGYFAVDKKETDEVIEKEIHEILHDKEAILNINNPRRFIFSKWTLREGWDNPNIFQICKLRSSGSEISKLQEVGRGLRLPVNEYGNRVKEEDFYLNYFVDFTESDFIDKLVTEINKNSDVISKEEHSDNLNDRMIESIEKIYGISKNELLCKLDAENIIDRSNYFKEEGLAYIQRNYPLIFGGVDGNKVRKSSVKEKKVSLRVEKYGKLKELWEKLNEKSILKYEIANESEFSDLLNKFFQHVSFTSEGLQQKKQTIAFKDGQGMVQEESSIGHQAKNIATMRYSDFLKRLGEALKVNIKTLHNALVATGKDINRYLNESTIRSIKQSFDDYLMYNATSQFSIAYQKVSSSVHPTLFTSEDGEVKKEVLASKLGVLSANETVASNYFLDKLFYDSELEKENITTEIKEIVVFTKIPKNAIKIPIAGGRSYSPDFAYVLKGKDESRHLYFVVETKNTHESALRKDEALKIKYAEKFFENCTITFKKQLSGEKIHALINEAYSKLKDFNNGKTKPKRVD